MWDSNQAMLEQVTSNEDFLRNLFLDELHDWSLAKAYGEYLVDACPELLLGYLILTRVYRHLGEFDRAMKTARQCRSVVARADFGEQAFLSDLEYEERLLASVELGPTEWGEGDR